MLVFKYSRFLYKYSTDEKMFNGKIFQCSLFETLYIREYKFNISKITHLILLLFLGIQNYSVLSVNSGKCHISKVFHFGTLYLREYRLNKSEMIYIKTLRSYFSVLIYRLFKNKSVILFSTKKNSKIQQNIF